MSFKWTHGIPSPAWGCGHALESPHWALGSGRASSSSSTTSSFQAVCVDGVPISDDKDSSVQTQQRPGISSREQQWRCRGGPRCPSRAPQSDKSPAWESINAREWGRELESELGQRFWNAKWLSGCHVKDVQIPGKRKELFSQKLRELLSQQSCDDSHFPRILGVKDTLDSKCYWY